MTVYALGIPCDRGLNNMELEEYTKKLGIKYFRGVFMLDTLPKKSNQKECGIVNLSRSGEQGSHWVCYSKDGLTRIYSDSFGDITPYFVGNTKISQDKGRIGIWTRIHSTK